MKGKDMPPTYFGLPLDVWAFFVSGMALIVAIAGTWYSIRYTKRTFEATYSPVLSFHVAVGNESSRGDQKHTLHYSMTNTSQSIALENVQISGTVRKHGDKRSRAAAFQPISIRLFPPDSSQELRSGFWLNDFVGEHFPDILRRDDREAEKRQRIARQTWHDSAGVPSIMDEPSAFYFVEAPTPLQLRLTATYTPSIRQAKPIVTTKMWKLIPQHMASDSTRKLIQWSVDDA